MAGILNGNAKHIGIGGISGVGATIVVYLITSNVFVTPAQLDVKLAERRASVAENYVAKVDYQRDIGEIKQLLTVISAKLDTKMDKPEGR